MSVNIGKRVMWAKRIQAYAAWIQFAASLVTVVIVAEMSLLIVLGVGSVGLLALYGLYRLDKDKLFREEQREMLGPLIDMIRELLREEGVSRHGVAMDAHTGTGIRTRDRVDGDHHRDFSYE